MQSGEQFEISQSRWKALLHGAGCIAFVALGWWMKDETELRPQMIGWISIALFGGFGIVWLSAAVWPAKLSVTRNGVRFHSKFRARNLAWSEIAGVETRKRHASTFVYLTLATPRTDDHWSDVLGRFLDWGSAGKFRLGTAWTISQNDLANQLNASRERFAGEPPSRSANPVVM